MTVERLAEQFRLKIARDDCGDQIIPGRHGHLYVDHGAVCAMWTDARPMKQSRLMELRGECWQGDISPNAKGKRVQDAWVKGIGADRLRQAIRMAGVKAKRIMSEKQQTHALSALSKAREKLPLIRPGKHSQPLGAVLDAADKR